MRLSSNIMQAKSGKNIHIGEIWTNGRKVFFAPADNDILKSIVADTVSGPGGTNYSAKDNPVDFVRYLPMQYRDTLYATEAKEE